MGESTTLNLQNILKLVGFSKIQQAYRNELVKCVSAVEIDIPKYSIGGEGIWIIPKRCFIESKAATILKPNQQINDIYLIAKGSVKLSMFEINNTNSSENPKKKERTLTTGDTFGDLSALGPNHRWDGLVVTANESCWLFKFNK